MPEVKKVFTLAAGNNRLSTMLAAVSTDIGMLLTHLRWRTLTGGPIAMGDADMAAITDGDAWAVGEGPQDDVGLPGNMIEATKIYFRPTAANDKIYLEARSGA